MRKLVQIEKAGSPGAWASSAVRETRPTGDSRDAARASEGAIGSLSADRYTDRPSEMRTGQAHRQGRAVVGRVCTGVADVQTGHRDTVASLFGGARTVRLKAPLIPSTHPGRKNVGYARTYEFNHGLEVAPIRPVLRARLQRRRADRGRARHPVAPPNPHPLNTVKP